MKKYKSEILAQIPNNKMINFQYLLTSQAKETQCILKKFEINISIWKV